MATDAQSGVGDCISCDLLDYPVDHGRVLIEAAAGSGKTYTIQYLFLRLVVERSDLKTGNILVVTFTEAATGELKERIRAILGQALRRLENLPAVGNTAADDLDRVLGRALEKGLAPSALRDRLQRARAAFDEVVIATIHGFCSRVLDEYAFECGLPGGYELETDSRIFSRQAAESYWRRLFYTGPETPERELVAGCGVTLEGLEKLAEKLENQPALVVLPEGPPPAGSWRAEYEALAAGLVRTRSAFRQGCAAALGRLETERERLEKVLFEGSPLKKGSWAVKDFAVRYSGLETMLQQGSRGEIPQPEEKHDYLLKFSREFLRNRTRKGQTTPEHPLFDFCEELCRQRELLLKGKGRLRVLIERDFVAFVRGPDGVAALKRRRRQRSYGDLLTGLSRRLGDPDRGPRLIERLRERFRVVMIDEFQDTDPVQYGIFETLFAAPGILFYRIGDPKQSIYAFRGADIFAYLDAAREPGQLKTTLERNFRSVPELLAALNRLFAGPRPFLFPEINYRPAQPGGLLESRLEVDGRVPAPLRFWFAEGAGGNDLNVGQARYRLARACARSLAALLRRGKIVAGGEGGSRPLSAGDIAILTRSNQQARIAREVCREVGIPAVLSSSESLWQSREARELFFLLEALLAPADDGALNRALATRLVGWDEARLAAVNQLRARPGAAPGQGELELYEAWRLAFIDVGELWRQSGLSAMLAAFSGRMPEAKAGFDLYLNLARAADGERALVNFLHLQEVLHEVESSRRLGPRALLDWFHLQLDGGGEEGDEYQLRLESEADAVAIMTVHKSKGLEFPVVFAPFLWDYKFTRKVKKGRILFHRRDGRGYRAFYDLSPEPGDENVRRAWMENLAEDLRLVYVALTRARYLACTALAHLIKRERGKNGLCYLARRPAAGEELEIFLKEGDKRPVREILVDMAGGNESDSGIVIEESGVWPAAGGERENGTGENGGFRAGADAALAPAAMGNGSFRPQPRVFSRRLAPAAGRLSFSRLTAVSGDTDSGVMTVRLEAADRPGGDEPLAAAFEPAADPGSESAAGPVAAVSVTASDGAREGSAAVSGAFSASATAGEDASLPPSALKPLPAGPGAGSAIHAILEEIDFPACAAALAAAADPENRARFKAELFSRWRPPLVAAGLLAASPAAAEADATAAGEEELLEGILAMVGRLVGVPLAPPPGKGAAAAPGGGILDLADPELECRAEMEFWLPLAPGFSPARLEAWGCEHLAPDWHLPAPGGLPERGFLNGFIDLVCCRDRRFWLIDWKSNHLGTNCGAYHPAALAADMRRHHYALQYHLYLVALDRWFRFRDPAYDYERDCAGVYYVYLRGLNGRDAATGIHYHRPEREALRELEKIVCG